MNIIKKIIGWFYHSKKNDVIKSDDKDILLSDIDVMEKGTYITVPIEFKEIRLAPTSDYITNAISADWEEQIKDIIDLGVSSFDIDIEDKIGQLVYTSQISEYIETFEEKTGWTVPLNGEDFFNFIEVDYPVNLIEGNNFFPIRTGNSLENEDTAKVLSISGEVNRTDRSKQDIQLISYIMNSLDEDIKLKDIINLKEFLINSIINFYMNLIIQVNDDESFVETFNPPVDVINE